MSWGEFPDDQYCPKIIILLDGVDFEKAQEDKKFVPPEQDRDICVLNWSHKSRRYIEHPAWKALSVCPDFGPQKTFAKICYDQDAHYVFLKNSESLCNNLIINKAQAVLRICALLGASKFSLVHEVNNEKTGSVDGQLGIKAPHIAELNNNLKYTWDKVGNETCQLEAKFESRMPQVEKAKELALEMGLSEDSVINGFIGMFSDGSVPKYYCLQLKVQNEYRSYLGGKSTISVMNYIGGKIGFEYKESGYERMVLIVRVDF